METLRTRITGSTYVATVGQASIWEDAHLQRQTRRLGGISAVKKKHVHESEELEGMMVRLIVIQECSTTPRYSDHEPI